jgi:meiotic recombination protein SPO11
MIQSVIDPLDRKEPPHIGTKSFYHSTHCRSLTSIIMVASFCYDLLKANRTTTTREVYYFFVTHFRNQAECDKAIWDLSALLRVSRSAMGLAASPKGWFCGCLDLYNSRGDLIVNGRELDSHGMAITSSTHKFAKITSDAKCILVIEKEGVYNRLSEDKFFLTFYPCILITGKGFPDVATRQWVQQLQRALGLPVYGLCDCNPFGISVLNTYHYGEVTTNKREPRDMSSLELQWIGLRPSQLEALQLPATVFQQLTPLDEKRLASLRQETHPFHQQGWNPTRRMEELHQMDRKVELEALNWKGMDFLCQWVHSILVKQDEADAAGAEEAEYII